MPTTPWYPVPANHPLLGEDALELDAAGLREWGLVAERLLEVRGADLTVMTGDAAQDLIRAVALQVSVLAATDPLAVIANATGVGSESIDYRDGLPLHPQAVAIVNQVFAEAEVTESGDSGGWPIFGGFRGPRSAGTARAEQATADALARRNRGLG